MLAHLTNTGSAFFEAISEGDRERVERILQMEYSSYE